MDDKINKAQHLHPLPEQSIIAHDKKEAESKEKSNPGAIGKDQKTKSHDDKVTTSSQAQNTVLTAKSLVN